MDEERKRVNKDEGKGKKEGKECGRSGRKEEPT